MTQKPGKGDFAPRGACPQTSLEVGNRSVFILDPHLPLIRFLAKINLMNTSRNTYLYTSITS